MLAAQPLWIPVAKYAPVLVEMLYVFMQTSPHTGLLLDHVKYRPEDTRVLLGPDARMKERPVVYAMAFPFTVTPAVCEAGSGDIAGEGVMSGGAFTSLVDTMTSAHVGARLMPSNDMHVSVSMQVNCVRPIRCGEKVVMITRTDKMGSRLAFTTAELLRDVGSGSGDTAQSNVPVATSLEEMEQLLRRFDVLAKGKQVKCIIRPK